MQWQSRLPAALTAIHNFIWDSNPDDIDDIADPVDLEPGAQVGELGQGVPRDNIVQEMWDQYLAYQGM